MTEVSNNLLWFLQMLRNAEATLAHALAQSERFNKHDREVIDKMQRQHSPMLLLNQKDLINTTEKSLTKLKRKL